jgi:hypothetical protein
LLQELQIKLDTKIVVLENKFERLKDLTIPKKIKQVVENLEDKLKLLKMETKSEAKKKFDSAIKKIENLEPQIKEIVARTAN